MMSDTDIVFVAGGNSYYLLDKVKSSGFDKIVKKRIEEGLIYVGSSAGSILCCPTIDGAKQFDDPNDAPNLKNYSGLDLINKIIIPHAQKEKYFERIKETTEIMEKAGYEVISLTDKQAVIVNGDKVKVASI